VFFCFFFGEESLLEPQAVVTSTSDFHLALKSSSRYFLERKVPSSEQA
jgi:hypothetical protein